MPAKKRTSQKKSNLNSAKTNASADILDILEDKKYTYGDFKEEIRADLLKVVEATHAGKQRPSYMKLCRFFADKYGVKVSDSTIYYEYQDVEREYLANHGEK